MSVTGTTIYLDQLQGQGHSRAVNRNELAQLRCQLAKELDERGDYEAARRAMGELWQQVDGRPNLNGLDQRTAAEVLLRAGSLTGRIGSAGQITGARQTAQSLLGGSIALFEFLGEHVRAAEAEIELAHCYWHDGALDQARNLLRQTLRRLAETENDLRAVALVRSAIVEWSAKCPDEALRLLTEAAPLAEASTSPSIKGRFHLELAVTLRNLGAAEQRPDYFERALVEYEAASYHFEQIGNARYQAIVENNVGFLFFTLERYEEAHDHLERARRLFVSLQDTVHTAQVDETLARVLVAEHRYAEAAGVVAKAVLPLQESRQYALLAEALTTQGVVLARLGQHAEARPILERARDVAEQCGDSKGAGLAALTLIEELCNGLGDDYRREVLTRADQLLGNSTQEEIVARLRACQVRAADAHEASERARAAEEERLRRQAYHDPLTGLANRDLLNERLGRACERAKHYGDYLFAVLYVDVDRFKIINDSLGHGGGDLLLVGVARRLKSQVREVDTVARLGGDEFVVLLDGIKDIHEASLIAERIQQNVGETFNLDGHEAFISVSIGITVSSTSCEGPDEMVRNADIAMYRAKMNGKARHELFDTQMHAGVVARQKLETDLRRAVERQEFHLDYQPVISLESGRLAGFEALMRWRHPERGVVAPGEFIPVAEENGLIVPLGRWALAEACRQVREWQRRSPAGEAMTLSVNLSGKQLEQSDLIEQVEGILRETGFNPRKLKLEITESVVMKNAEGAAVRLNGLRKLGVELAIDDFGTGYSSLSYLHRFPVSTLKVDRSFVGGIDNGGDEKCAIVQTIVQLARNLRMDVVAEGVETEKQLDYLAALGCEYVQGYLLSRPLSAEAAGALVENNRHWPMVRSSFAEVNHLAGGTRALNTGELDISDLVM